MDKKLLRVGKHGALVLPKQTLKDMGIGVGESVRVIYNADFKELVIRPLKKRFNHKSRSGAN